MRGGERVGSPAWAWSRVSNLSSPYPFWSWDDSTGTVIFSLGLVCLNVNSLIKKSSDSCGVSDVNLCRYINNQESIFCLNDTRVDAGKEVRMNSVLYKGHTFGLTNIKKRVYTTLNREPAHHHAGVTTIFPEKLDNAFESIKWFLDKHLRPRYGLAVCKLKDGPMLLITNLYGRPTGKRRIRQDFLIQSIQEWRRLNWHITQT